MMLMILRVLIGLSVLGMVGLLRMVLLKLGKVLLRILLWLLKVVWMFKLMIGRLLVGSILMFKLLLVGVKRIVQVRLQQLLFIFDHLQGLLPLFHRKISLSLLYFFHLFEHDLFFLVKNSQFIEIYQLRVLLLIDLFIRLLLFLLDLNNLSGLRFLSILIKNAFHFQSFSFEDVLLAD